ncbi:hypothetical protein SAMD00024442_81_3 [Candidatus Symbiothrix dinenymphae]|nr:hypothetical protein SAMD00024442_81_3 [Candidatus Symbiothrix dinenymphae]
MDEDMKVFTEQEVTTIKELLERLAVVVAQPVSEAVRAEVDALKQDFYKLRYSEMEAAKKVFVDGGGAEEDFKPEQDEVLEGELKRLLAAFREKKAAFTAEREVEQAENLKKKKAIIAQIKALAETNGEDFQKSYTAYKQLQHDWKAVGQVAQNAVNELWKDYHRESEKFYDLVKINNEMRDYDFKKNLELKVALCEAVERLDAGKDVVSAFYQLQKLHDEWREIGPAAREVRDEVWARFKTASGIINKKHQVHFESLKEKETEHLAAKVALCEVLEAIDFSKLTTAKEWDEQNRQVLDVQAKWKTIGFAPKKENNAVFARFRAACNRFFNAKSEFYKSFKDALGDNLSKKENLCEQAEALKDSEDWKKTTDAMIALQKEWKTVGQVSRKYSDAVWRRFVAACDVFFVRKKEHFDSLKASATEQTPNVQSDTQEAKRDKGAKKEKEARKDKEVKKDKGAKKGKEATYDREAAYDTEATYDREATRDREATEHKEPYQSQPRKIDRKSLWQQREQLKSEVQTYETNISFLRVSSKSKTGNELVQQVEAKIAELKAELARLEESLRA